MARRIRHFRIPRFLPFAAAGAAATALLLSALPAAAGEAPWLSLRPIPRPDPQAEWRAERRDEDAGRRAFEAGRREDRQDWLWGGSWRAWLDARREAERARIEARRADRLERRRVRPDGDVRDLGARLDDQWHRQRALQRDRGDSRFSGPRPGRVGPRRR